MDQFLKTTLWQQLGAAILEIAEPQLGTLQIGEDARLVLDGVVARRADPVHAERRKDRRTP